MAMLHVRIKSYPFIYYGVMFELCVSKLVFVCVRARARVRMSDVYTVQHNDRRRSEHDYVSRQSSYMYTIQYNIHNTAAPPTAQFNAQYVHKSQVVALITNSY